MAQSSGRTKNKMGGRRSEGHVTDHRNKRMEETSGRQRRMEASSREANTPEGAVTPWMDGWMDRWISSLEPVASVDLVSVSD